MPKFVTEYRCFLISPNDVAAERDVLTDVARKWNAQVGVRLRSRIELVRWETHGVPDLSDSPQGVINKQILLDCDFGVAVFWSRLGTATAEYASGSLEEIERLRTLGKRIVVYFCDRPVPQDRLRDTQFQELTRFRERLSSEGLVGRFTATSELAELFFLNLTNIVTAATGHAYNSEGVREKSATTAPSTHIIPYEFKDDFARAVTHIELERRGYRPFHFDPYRKRTWDAGDYLLDALENNGKTAALLIIQGEAYFSEPAELHVPKELISYSDPETFFIFVRLTALYERPLFYIVPSKVVSERVTKTPGAPQYVTFRGITQDLTDRWYFRDALGEFLEAWQLLGPPPTK